MKNILIVILLLATSFSFGQSMKGLVIGQKYDIKPETEIIEMDGKKVVVIKSQTLAGYNGGIMVILNNANEISGLHFVTTDYMSSGEFEAFKFAIESNYNIKFSYNDEHKYDDEYDEYVIRDGWIEYTLIKTGSNTLDDDSVFFSITNNNGSIDGSDF